jgi:hypothetical protein
MIFDTGSNWLWVNSIDCINCPAINVKFNYSSSATFKNTGESIRLLYGSGGIRGQHVYDQVCLTQTECTKQFSFINVLEQQGLN